MTIPTQGHFIAVDKDGKAVSRRIHLFENCSFLDDCIVKGLTVSESSLLGLKPCVVCEKRRAGGPAIDVLEGFFGEDSPGVEEPGDAARTLHAYLRERGWYLAQRAKKDV